MEITEHSTPAGRTYRLSGRLDAHQSPRLKAAIEPLPGDLTLDFGDVSFIDSTGLATLVGVYRRSQERGFDLRIINLQDQVRVIFEITQLHQVLPVESGG